MGNELGIEGDDLVSDLAAAALVEQMVRTAYGSRVSADIQPLQWSIIRYISRTPRERCTLSWIKSYLGRTHAPVSRAIKKLVERELIVPRPNPDDARSSLLELTETGMEIAKADPLLRIVDSIGKLPPGDRKRFRDLVRTVALTLTDIDGQ